MRKRTTAGVVIGGVALALVAVGLRQRQQDRVGGPRPPRRWRCDHHGRRRRDDDGGRRGDDDRGERWRDDHDGRGGSGETLKVDTSKCPADATTAFPAGSTIKIGFPTALDRPGGRASA